MASLISKDSSGVFAAQPDETEVERTRGFKRWSLPDAPDGGKRSRVAGQTGPIHYRLDPFSVSEEFKEIDLDILLTPGESWDASCESNGYQVRFWQSRVIAGKTVRYIVQFRRGGKWVSIAPLALIYTNTAGQKQLIRRPAAVAPVIDNDAHAVTWPNAFGTDIDFRYNVRPDDFFKTVIFHQDPRVVAPPTIGLTGLRVVLVMGVAWHGDMRAANGFASMISPTEINGNDTLADAPDEILADPAVFSFLDAIDRPHWWLQKPRAWDSSVDLEGVPVPKEIDLAWRLLRKGSVVFAALSAPITALEVEGITFPVYMDADISEIQVAAGTDDALNRGATFPGDGNYSTTNTTSTLGYDGFNGFWIHGVRFLAVPVPQGATINTASISVMAHATTSNDLNTTIYCHDRDDEVTFTVTSHEPYDCFLAKTTTLSNWNIGVNSWTAGSWYGGTSQSYPNDAAIPFQEVVNRAGWVSGYDVGFVIVNGSSSGSGQQTRAIRSWDYSGNVSGPKFNCSYTEGGGAAAAAPFVPRHIWGPGFAEGWGIR